MAKDALKKIVRAAKSYRNTKPGLVDHPYFNLVEDKKWTHVTTFLRTKNVKEKKS